MRKSSVTQDAVCLLQVDRRRLKAVALHSMRNHAQAMRGMRVAGMLQIQQRPLPVLIAIAAWSDQHHELWKYMAWNAWRGYCMRRIRFKTLCGIMACRCLAYTICSHTAYMAQCTHVQRVVLHCFKTFIHHFHLHG